MSTIRSSFGRWKATERDLAKVNDFHTNVQQSLAESDKVYKRNLTISCQARGHFEKKQTHLYRKKD